MYYGADYYPEHWPKERIPEDVKLMKEANFNMVRMAEFAWHKMESSEGNYDFSWLDRAMELLNKENIDVVLCTPTATPPKWLMDRYPEIYQVDRQGIRRGFGSRRHYCFNSPVYREYTKKIVTTMAEHYRGNAQVAAWQIDNEFGCHDNRCYCENCRKSFIDWLKNKYQTIDRVNEAWGTVFWSQTYNSWDEIILPAYTECDSTSDMTAPSTHNPSLQLDYYRFVSDSVRNYQKLQLDILRTFTKKPITHNFMGHFSDLDYFDQAEDLDFVSWDNYIYTPWNKADYEEVSMAHDLMRGLKQQNYWVMEQQSGPCGWNTMGNTPSPGQIRLWAYQAVAHGGEGILFFRWRTCLFGTEQYWHGILDHDGIPRRRFEEIKQTGEEMVRLGSLLDGSENPSEVCLIKSYENLWSHGIQPHSKGFDYNDLLKKYYQVLCRKNMNVDVTSIDSDLDNYKLLIMPAFNLIDEKQTKKISNFVKKGGVLVVTFRSGTRNRNNVMSTESLPGNFRDLAGIRVTEFNALSQGESVSVKGMTMTGCSQIWNDIIELDSAQSLAEYEEEYYMNQPAITVNDYGKGSVFYIGCDLDESGLEELFTHIFTRAAIKPNGLGIPWGVELVRRVKKGEEYFILMNHNHKEIVISLGRNYRNRLTGVDLQEQITLPAYGVLVISPIS
jgi:beta-galactosidase